MKKYKLGKIADIIAGQSPESKFYSSREGIPFLQGNRTFGDKYPGIDSFTTKTTKLAKKGSILISVRAPVGDMNIACCDTCIGRGIGAINSKDNLNEYLYYNLKNSISNLHKKSNGTTYDSITSDILSDYEVFIHDSHEERKKVGEFFSSIDDKIALNRCINAKLEAMAKLLYNYWFVQFDFPNTDGKPYKSSGGKMVWNEVLKREIPEGWEVIPLKNCINNITTGLNPRDNFVLGKGKIKYITVKNLTESGNIDFSNCDLIDEDARSMVHFRSNIRIDDILFASICPLGRLFLINEEPKDWDINESVFSIHPNPKKVSSQLLYYILRDDYYVKKMTQKATGSIFKGIRVDDLEKTEILLSPKNIIDLFTKKITQILNEQSRRQKESEKLANLRDKLLPLLMNGQVEVG